MVRTWQDGSCNSWRKRMPMFTTGPLLLLLLLLLQMLLLLLLTVWQRANPTDLDARRLSSETKAISAPLALTSASQSTTAKKTVSCVWAQGGVEWRARARRHLLSPLPNVLEDRRCSSVRQLKGGGRSDK